MWPWGRVAAWPWGHGLLTPWDTHSRCGAAEVFHPRVHVFRVIAQEPELFDVRLGTVESGLDSLTKARSHGAAKGVALKAMKSLLVSPSCMGCDGSAARCFTADGPQLGRDAG